jgi:Asp-tRNA(Asn)/Glu-tRNA(Gln) amidotransferase A subunit family amidase
VGIKDVFRVEGYPTRCGSALPASLFEGAEAISVRALKDAGAVIMGKTVTTEFAWFEPGPTRNPHHPGHTPGGSSSGSAAGVAAGFFLLALGTQTAGSIIRPAAFCGVVGFKPSQGRISTAGIVPTSPSLDQVGFFCLDPSALAVVSSALIPDWKPLPELSQQRDPVLGIPEGDYLNQASENGRQHFQSSVQKLQSAGYRIRRLNPFPHLEITNRHHLRLVAGEMARVHAFGYRSYPLLYRTRTVETIEEGFSVSNEELKQYRREGLRLREELQRKMASAGIDVWICPSAPDHAPEGLESTGSAIMNLPWTYAGLPTISLPSGLDAAHLPHGLQVVGRHGEDELLVVYCQRLWEVIRP